MEDKSFNLLSAFKTFDNLMPNLSHAISPLSSQNEH